MLNNNIEQLEYINKLENENKLLKAENKRLKKAFLSDCDKYKISLLRLKTENTNLKRENTKLRQHNTMLTLMC